MHFNSDVLTAVFNASLSPTLHRARRNGVRQILVFDPSGSLQQRHTELEEAVQWSDAPGSIVVWCGWQPPAGWEPGTEGLLGVALLSAEDAEWPLVAAAAASASGRHSDTPQQLLKCADRAAALQEALGAPADVRARLVEVAGPVAGLEPDLVLVRMNGRWRLERD